MLPSSVVSEIRGIVEETDLDRKLAAAARLGGARATLGAWSRGAEANARLSCDLAPGRPPSWSILPPHEVPDRGGLATSAGRRRLLHAVANIELAAIELALLTAGDFPWMEAAFHSDWLRVAAEEVEHFQLVRERLRRLGAEVGEEPVHLGLFQSAREETTLAGRLGVVPRILEARGLDVSAPLRRQLAAAGDPESAAVLARIYDDEIGHVAAGTLWFRAICHDAGVDPEARFLDLLARHRGGRRRRWGAVDREGRAAAGFSERELAALEEP